MQDITLNKTHKIQATDEQINSIIEYYKGYLQLNTSEYIITRAKLANATITMYKTNTVLFQGPKATTEYNHWANEFGLETQNEIEGVSEDISSLSAIGTDEVGTGDYFGPIVVCAAYVPSDKIEALKHLGVKDSKLLTDKQMIPLGIKLAEMIPYSIMKLEPSKINALSKKYDNLNFVKAYLHNKAINSILKKLSNVKYDAILIDEFTPKEKYYEYLKDQEDLIKEVTLIPRGENAHVAIAAASVLARVAFLRELKNYSKNYDIELLKGAGREVDRNACQLVRNYGWDELPKVAKMKFANTDRIKEYFSANPLPKIRQKHQENI